MAHLIEVREHGRVSVPEHIVESTPFAFWRSAGCDVTKTAVNGSWILRAGSSVGVTRIRSSSGDVTLRIHPKLATANVFFMADYAYEQRHEPLTLLDHDVGLESVLRDPTACLLVWHARTIHRFASRWLRRDYRSVARVLNGKVKGRIFVHRYVSDHLAVGDASRIPCRVQERTQDTANNRLLKAGLRYIATASHNLPVPAARRAVLRQVNSTLPLFGQVSDIRVSPSDIRATSSRGPQRHYAAVLAATIGLLRNRLMGDDLSLAQTTSAFMWQMPVLFQESIRGLIGSAPGFVLASDGPGTTRIYDADGQRRRSSKVDPDLVLRMEGGASLLIDTKYKDALPSDYEVNIEEVTTIANRHRIRVPRSDVYQVVAYREHEKWPNSTAALLYPVVLAAGDRLPAPLEVRGFGAPIALLFIDIGWHATANLPDFLETLGNLVSRTPEFAIK